MPVQEKHRWAFAPRFRARAFGWKSQPAIQRVREAVSEIKKTAKKDPVLAADGAVLFLEKVSPALEQVDSSSGAIGTAVSHAIEALVEVLARASADDRTRDRWLERLFEALQNDEIPYLEILGESWGELCVTRERAATWADRLLPTVRMAWADPFGYCKGTAACLSSLLTAGRHPELLALHWIAGGWGYEITGFDVLEAGGNALEAARAVGVYEEILGQLEAFVAEDRSAGMFIRRVLGPRLEQARRQAPAGRSSEA